jgi:hypothetical protein
VPASHRDREPRGQADPLPLTEEEIERIAEAVARRLQPVEPWMDRKKLAEHYSTSVRSIDYAMKEGLPYKVLFGRAKFRVSEVEEWLEARGLSRVPEEDR